MKSILIPIGLAFYCAASLAQMPTQSTITAAQSVNASGAEFFAPKLDAKGRLSSLTINGKRVAFLYAHEFSKRPIAIKIDGIARTVSHRGKRYTKDEIDVILDKHGTTAEALANPAAFGEALRAASPTRRPTDCEDLPLSTGPNSSRASIEQPYRASSKGLAADGCSGDGDTGDGDWGGDWGGDAGDGSDSDNGGDPMEDPDFWDSYFGDPSGIGSATWGTYNSQTCKIEASYCGAACNNWATAGYGICGLGAAAIGSKNILGGILAGAACVAVVYRVTESCLLDCQTNVICL